MRSVFTLPFPLVVVLLLAVCGQARADSTVVDETGLMTQNAISQIDNRNSLLQDNTGTFVGVLVQPGTGGETALDATTVATKALGQKFGVLIWVATDSQKADIVFADQALKWITPDQQRALRSQLVASLRYCCPSDTIPDIVDNIATALESGAKIPIDPRNYIRDDLGLLDAAHVSSITAREEQLESTTGKGIGVILMEEQPGTTSSALALSDAQSLNVKGAIAAVIWVARNNGTVTFNMITAPAYVDAIPDSAASNINASFQADMQSGQLADAIGAAVDRTAAALEASSTPMPSVAPLQSPEGPAASGSPAETVGATPAGAPNPTTVQSGTSSTSSASTAFLLLIGFAVLILIVIMALRRRNQ